MGISHSRPRKLQFRPRIENGEHLDRDAGGDDLTSDTEDFTSQAFYNAHKILGVIRRHRIDQDTFIGDIRESLLRRKGARHGLTIRNGLLVVTKFSQ